MKKVSIKKGVVEVVTKTTLTPETKGPTFSMSEKIGRKLGISRCFVCDWPFQWSGETVNPVLFKYHKVEYLCCDCVKKL